MLSPIKKTQEYTVKTRSGDFKMIVTEREDDSYRASFIYSEKNGLRYESSPLLNSRELVIKDCISKIKQLYPEAEIEIL